MTVARITEISSISKKSFEDAVIKGVVARQQDAEEREGRVGQGPGSDRRQRQDHRLQGDPEGHVRAERWRGAPSEAAQLGEHFLGLLVGVVRGTHQRADRGVAEAHRLRLAFELREHVRMHVALHRQVARRGLQVLADA